MGTTSIIATFIRAGDPTANAMASAMSSDWSVSKPPTNRASGLSVVFWFWKMLVATRPGETSVTRTPVP
ncbi:hypothetical protein ACVIW3_007187 [Bradyrhizobium diazoefficiens]|uniref:Uncharacterized protein n=1 Tax=Bradyrhizobium diazoefficiens TaxID=1355477 RepID=A0A809X364_9BRAD|nr:hypothetical protein [Bradyrhizobium japonicum]BCA03227.1 hypothetical protein H12S4_41310 [Bradyrhizobium diazoefficiens]BCE21203.1 hypothetical protein XF1B_38840 [Bradyrhizobium diazoefficiens]BCE47450.1 hypothetical protein XF4B_37990 [Bradyrhizobium diazoefficiens]BCF34749.1 hypothetical protein XF15B_38200 [Bradyrhizobium diazoefficiens]